MNLILEKSEHVKFYTNMGEVLTALGNICCEFDWYISDMEKLIKAISKKAGILVLN